MQVRLTTKIVKEISKCSKKLQQYFVAIIAENKRLREENEKLRQNINKNSTNSNLPPSANPFKKIQSLRAKTGRKPGAQDWS